MTIFGLTISATTNDEPNKMRQINRLPVESRILNDRYNPNPEVHARPRQAVTAL